MKKLTCLLISFMLIFGISLMPGTWPVYAGDVGEEGLVSSKGLEKDIKVFLQAQPCVLLVRGPRSMEPAGYSLFHDCRETAFFYFSPDDLLNHSPPRC